MTNMVAIPKALGLFCLLLQVLNHIRPTVGAEDCDSPQAWTPLDPPEGVVTWSDTPDDCTEYWYWVVQDTVPSGTGIVLDVHNMQVAPGDELKIFDNIQIHRSYPVRRYSSENRDTAPVLLYTNQAVILAHTARGSSRESYSSFNITVATHPLSSMPEGVRLVSGSKDIGSRHRYNCSSFSSAADLPGVLLCDNVPQCIGGQDEANCDYLQQGCGDWLPYKDRCLKFVFSYVFIHKPDTLYDTFPLLAERNCVDNYQAKLVHAPDQDDKEFLGKIIQRSGFGTVVVGLKKVRAVSSKSRRLYRFLWQWGGVGGPVDYDQQRIQRDGIHQGCSVLKVNPVLTVSPYDCVLGERPDGYVCSKPNPLLQKSTTLSTTVSVALSPASEALEKFPTKRCVDGSLVQTFHSCPRQVKSSAGGFSREQNNPDTSSGTESPARYSSSGTLPLLQCRYGEAVHYSLTCDGFNDCMDGSDELGCESPRFEPFLNASFVCRNLQTIPKALQCNGLLDCLDDSDEEDCAECNGPVSILYSQRMCPEVGCIPYVYTQRIKTCPVLGVVFENDLQDLHPAQVTLDGYGMSRLDPLKQPGVCPETHYPCPGGFCIPTFLLNNGEQDCLGGEDENISNDNFTCPGFYRCYRTMNCVHPSYVCDGIPHCPNRDDELFCDLACPGNCTCEGYAYTCQGLFDVRQHLHLRYLDLSGMFRPPLVDLHLAEYLHFLNLSSCHLSSAALKGLRQLRVLDLSDNFLSSLTSLRLEDLGHLQDLYVSNNPLMKRLDPAFRAFLHTAGVKQLKTLVLINISLEHLEEGVLDSVGELVVLDVRGNAIESFDLDVFRGLDSLRVLRTDSSKLCCSLSASVSAQCQAPTDELSSCSDLLRSDFFRVFLWALSFLAISGNVGVLVYRLFVERGKALQGYRVLVMNLCVSDCLMGVYLAIIGAADAQYRGHYVTQDSQWRHSASCQAAGFLALLSSEMSAFVLCLITADRVLALCFPLHPRLHVTKATAMAACGSCWMLGVLLASVPLLPSTRHWRFYSQTGTCLPLPITRRSFPGQGYTFAIFTVLNFTLFCVIACGQLVIFRAIHRASVAANNKTKRQEQEMTITRRLFVVVVSDFCCWFPIGVMGLLAAGGGTPIPGEVTVWAAVFVLPVNSALNPFLYTLKAASETWSRRRAERRTRIMMRKLQAEIDRWPTERVEVLVQYCLHNKLAGRRVSPRHEREITMIPGKMEDHQLSSHSVEANTQSTSFPGSSANVVFNCEAKF